MPKKSKTEGSKITLGMLKGKSVTTSVPSISIRFHANAEQLEELYGSADEDNSNSSLNDPPAASSSEAENSPLRYFPKIIKRSTSVDITAAGADASTSPDPWRFLSDIKGKITKSVEDKLTEYKSRGQEDGSPLKTKTKDSNLSDSEELSESSLSKTCGAVSTTEGAEMSSEEDTPSIEKDKTADPKKTPAASTQRQQRFRFLRHKSPPKEGLISTGNLSRIYNINADKIEQALPVDNEVESGVDALDDNWQTSLEVEQKIFNRIGEKYDNIKMDRKSRVCVKEVSGDEVRKVNWSTKIPKTVYAPVGFVDMRGAPRTPDSGWLPFIMLSVLVLLYALVHSHSSYWSGILLGVGITYSYFYIKNLLHTPTNNPIPQSARNRENILEISAVQECQPINKYESWMNELPLAYNPYTYHISQTQSVYIRLQGNLLRVSHARNKVPKRALWNEPPIKPIFTHHRIYNLMGAQIYILPEGLAKRKHWSKKYPICIHLNKDQLNFDQDADLLKEEGDQEDEEIKEKSTVVPVKQKRSNSAGKRKKTSFIRFSKLAEEDEDYAMDSDNSRASSPSPSTDVSELDIGPGESEMSKILNEDLKGTFADDAEEEDDRDSLHDDWGTFTSDESPTETKLYLFGRTDREKEDWYRRFKAATHKYLGASMEVQVVDSNNEKTTEEEYVKYMLAINKASKNSSLDSQEDSQVSVFPEISDRSQETPVADLLWLNALVGRVLFDCFRDDVMTLRAKDRIQRKLASIKLPYFIEELLVTELNLGQSAPLVHKASKPAIDERGLWVDLDVTYNGNLVLIINTKLNLMKLKELHDKDKVKNKQDDRPAMFHSDIDDSAESTSDDDSVPLIQAPLDAQGLPVSGLGGTSTASKRFIKMVDKIAESKLFHMATENKYIKKALEDLSNTNLTLRVEVSKLVGTLVLNIPAPPSDRVWIGFRPTPELGIVAKPIVGKRNITFLRITSWIEKKLHQEFQKLLVIPNMEDIQVPVMCQKLPE